MRKTIKVNDVPKFCSFVPYGKVRNGREAISLTLKRGSYVEGQNSTIIQGDPLFPRVHLFSSVFKRIISEQTLYMRVYG